MGQEVMCRTTWKRQSSDGRAQLETDYLLFRGDFRLKLPFNEMKKISAAQGRLIIDSAQGKLILELGARAERWADKILHPPSVLDKLGVQAGHKISVIGSVEPGFSAEISDRTGTPVSTRPRKGSDAIFVFAEEPRSAARVEKLLGSLQPAGAIWLVYPKGRKELTENDVIDIGRDAGLKDVKVAKFSETHTALKFVIPVEAR